MNFTHTLIIILLLAILGLQIYALVGKKETYMTPYKLGKVGVVMLNEDFDASLIKTDACIGGVC